MRDRVEIYYDPVMNLRPRLSRGQNVYSLASNVVIFCTKMHALFGGT
jgi:hypothetical protein